MYIFLDINKSDPPKPSVILETFDFWPERSTMKMPSTTTPKPKLAKPVRKQKGLAKKTPVKKGPFTMNDLQDLVTRVIYQILSDSD